MEFGNIIPLAISLLFLLFVVFGFLVGLIRGLKKTVIRTIWIVVIGVLLMFITTPIALSLLRSDITWIPGIAEAFQGASSLEEFLVTSITQNVEGISAQDIQPIISLVTSIVAMAISGLLFLLFFILLKYLSLPLYWILNIFIGKSKGNKRRLLGGAVGALLGVLIFTFVSTPIVGYVNIVKKIDDISANLTATPYTASANDDGGEGLLSQSPVGEIIDSFDNAVIVKVYDAIGLKSLQLVIFNQTSAVKINKETIKINNEIDSIGKVVVQILPFTDGSIDLNNFEGILNDPEQIEYLSTSVTSLLTSLYESKLFTTTLDTVMPILSSVMETAISDTLLSEPGMDPTVAQSVKTIISDLCTGIASAKPEKIGSMLNSFVDLVAIFPKLTSEDGIASLTTEDFSKLGASLDSIIDSGLIKQESISELIPVTLDAFINSLDPEDQLTQSFKTVVEELKQAFSAKDVVYANEFKAIGELVIGFTSLDFENEEIALSEQIKSVGEILDKAFSHNSKILTNRLVDSLVIGILDTISVEDYPELEGYEEIFDLVKKPFENHEITSYKNEFEAFAGIIDYAMNLGETEEIELTEIGKELDNVLSKDSKIINREFVNSIITILIDGFKEDIGEDLQPILETVKDKITKTEISFEKEFGSIEKLLDTFENIDGEELDLAEIGKTLDEVIEESDIIDHEVINSAISIIIEEFAGELGEDLKPTIDEIKNNILENEVSFEKELGSIKKLVDTFENIDSENVDLEEIGKTLDEVIEDSDIIDHKVISSAISVIVKQFSGDLGEDLQPVVEQIKYNLTTNEVSFEVELGSIKKLLDTFEDFDSENLDLESIGKTLDEVIEDSEIIDHEVINSAITVLFKEFTGDLGEDLLPTIDVIKDNVITHEVSFEKELGSIKKLLDVFEDVDGEDLDLTEIGKTLDDVIAESDIINCEVINSAIKVLINKFTDELGEEFKPAIEVIKTNISGELVYEDEFASIKKLLDTFESIDGEDLDLEEIGKTLDEVIEESNIINHKAINSAISIFIDEFASEIDGSLQSTVESIKNKLTSSTISYEKEFKAINKLINSFENINDSELDLVAIGKTLDEVIAESNVIDHALINSAIVVFVDKIDVEIDESLQPTVDEIKNKLKTSVISYEREFKAINKLIDSFETIDLNNIDLEEIAQTLDELVLESNIIDHALINSAIKVLIDEFTVDIDTAYAPVIESIKNAFSGNLTYETECWAIQHILEIINTQEDLNLPRIGKTLDEVLGSSQIVTRKLINDTIQILIDENTDNISANNQATIADIKNGFNRTDLSYETEFKALDSLLDMLVYANGSDVALSTVGEKIDSTLGIGSKIITRDLINDTIQLLIDEASSNISTNNQGTITNIKNGFKRNDLVYATEFKALESLLNMLDYANGSYVDLSTVGEKIDDTLLINSKIITRSLINDTIQLLIDETAGDVDAEYQPTITDIKNGFKGDALVYKTEFKALASLLDVINYADSPEVDLSNVGKQLDETLAIGSTIIDYDLINSCIQILIHESTANVNAEYESTIDEIRNGFEGELVYETEFLALESLIDVFNYASSNDVDLATVGVKFDKTLELNSKIITRDIINSSIKTLIDEATHGVNTKHASTINSIKNGFNRIDLVYSTEFLALDSLLDVFDFAGSNDVDLPKVGKQLDDTLDYNSKIITRSLINSSIQVLIDDATEDVNAKHQATVNSIKNGFNRIDLIYSTEFLALDSLLKVFDYANSDVDLANVGEQLDATLDYGSKIITRSLINSSIQVLIDEATDDVNADYNDIIANVKNGFNGDELVYKTEFEALDILLNVIDEAEHDIELKFIGQELDYIVITIKSKVITRNLINSAIKVLIDTATSDVTDSHVVDTINQIKNGFNSDDLNYELELTTIDKLIDTLETSTEDNVDLPLFGQNLDDIIALNGTIVNKALINDFIASSFDTFVSADDISHAGSLATSLSNIKVRVIDDNYQITSYKAEFTAVDKLIEISSIAGHLTIQQADAKLFDDNTKTIGEVFDDKIKDSVLLGDCGLDVLDCLIDTLNEQNDGSLGNKDYTKITSIIDDNFDAIKPNVKCASNKNLDKLDAITYVQLINSFTEIEHYLEDETDKVTGHTEFNVDLASHYEETLDKLQNNVLLDKNGTRAVASYICDEIATILEDKASAMPYPTVAETIRSYKNMILNYKAYLERPTTLANNRLNENEPYNSSETVYYVSSTDGFITNISFRTTKPTVGSYSYRTKPFTSIASEISSLLS